MENRENKDEWKEIEEWEMQRQQEMEDKYGIDITKLEPSKSINKITSAMVKIFKFLCIATAVLYAFIIIMAYVVLIISYMGVWKKMDESNGLFNGMFPKTSQVEIVQLGTE